MEDPFSADLSGNFNISDICLYVGICVPDARDDEDRTNGDKLIT